MSNANFQDSAIQFPRLLTAILASQEIDWGSLVLTMGMSIEEIKEMFGRAEKAWENIEAGNQPLTTINLNIFDDEGNVVDGTTVEMTSARLSDVIDHAAQLVLVRRSPRRSSGDTDGILAELEEALVVAGVVES